MHYKENKEVFTSSHIQNEMTQNYLTQPTLAEDFPEALYALLQSGKFDDSLYHFSVNPITFDSLQSQITFSIYSITMQYNLLLYIFPVFFFKIKKLGLNYKIIHKIEINPHSVI